jgi:O-antigen ligase
MSDPLANNRPLIWEWAQTLILAVNLAWTTICLGGFLPGTVVLTISLTGLLLVVHFVGRMLDGRPVPSTHPAGWLFLPFLVYAAANVIWVTPVRWLGWQDWFGWAQMSAVFWVVLNGVRSPAPRRALLGTLAGLGVVAVALGCYQRFVQPSWLMLGREQADQFVSRASGCFGIPNSLAALLLLLLPAAGVLAFHSRVQPARCVAAAAVALFLALGLVLTVSRGAWISLALALVAWPLFAVRSNWLRRLGVAALAMGAVLLAGAALFLTSTLVRERFTALVRDAGELSRPILWRVGWQLFREHPAAGTGAGSYNVLFEQHRPEGFVLEPKWAHNDYLNTLSDYGAVGFALFFGACGMVAWRCARGRRDTTACADIAVNSPNLTGALAVGVAAFAMQLFVDFHFKIPALAMAFAAVCALIVQQCWQTAAAERPLRLRARSICGAAAIACAAATVFFALPRFRAEALRYRAHRAIDRVALYQPDAAGYRAALPGVRADLARAVALDPANAQAWADLSYALSLAPHAEPERGADQPWILGLGREAEAAAERALALTKVSGEFFIRRGVARDMQGRWLDAGDDFTKATSLHPTQARAWYYYAYHLSLNPRDPGMTDVALAFCLRLDPGNSDGLALRQHLAISRKAP